MSQFNYAGAIDPLINGGNDLNTALDAYELAQNSNHSGASRPAYLPANGVWVKTVSGTQHEFTYFDGTDDIIVFTVNPTNNSVVFNTPIFQEVTPEVVTEGQNWAGVAYTDPDAVGANPSASIYPDGTVVGETDNGKYTKYPNGDLECRGSGITFTMNSLRPSIFGSGSGTVYVGSTTVSFPVVFTSNPEISDGGNANCKGLFSQTISTSSFEIGAYSTNTGTVGTAQYTTKGRWK